MTTRRSLLAALSVLPACAARRVAVIAHRGEHLTHPENTLPAIDAAIAIGCDWVEIDVRTTLDGHFVLMHNNTVDATTDGKGAVADMTLAEIRRLDAGARMPGFADTRVPTLDEALALMSGKCGVYFDAKQISAAAILDALKRHSMLDRCVVYGGFDLLKALGTAGYARLAMPEAVSVEMLRKSLAELKPEIVAFDRRDFRDDTLAIVREAGKGIFVDRLGGDDNEAAWEDAVKRGATGIQTDRSAEAIRLLTRLGYR